VQVALQRASELLLEQLPVDGESVIDDDDLAMMGDLLDLNLGVDAAVQDTKVAPVSLQCFTPRELAKVWTIKLMTRVGLSRM
jgi:hypothetical protein